MSLQIGSSTLTTYRNFKEQLLLTTSSSNTPIIALNSSHTSNNVFIRAGAYVIGQSNSDFLIGYSNASTAITNAYNPAMQFLSKDKIIKFHHNIDASNINTSIGKLNVSTVLEAPKIITSNIIIVFNSNINLPTALQDPEFVVRTPLNNLFVINGYNANSYFTGNLGIGTTNPVARLHTTDLRVDTQTVMDTLSLNSISFNNLPGTIIRNDAGSIRMGRNAIFDSNVNVLGNLQVASFQIINLNTNEGNFTGRILLNNSMNIQNASNELPSLNVTRRYLESNIFEDTEQRLALQPIANIEYIRPIVTPSLTSNATQCILRIDPQGRIGIGTTSPHRFLDIFSYQDGELGSNTGIFGIHGDRSEEIFCVDCNAFVGIGTSTPRTYIDMYMHSNSFAYTQAPAFLSIMNTDKPVLWLSPEGTFGVHTSNTNPNTAMTISGVLQTEFLSVHRIIPVEGPDVHFTNCNIDAVNTIRASNAFIPIITTSNIYADFISASNYDLLAFNSFRSTKELEFELDDMIFSGRTFILNSTYQPYFEQIGGTNPFGGLEGTTDPTLANKPTDKLNIARTGKIHIIADGSITGLIGNDTQYPTINNGLVVTSSNLFSGTINQDIAPFIHVAGHGPVRGSEKRRVGGYSVGLTNPSTAGDSLLRFTLEQNPVEAQSMIDTCAISIKPYDASTRRIGLRYNYSGDVLRTPKLFITNNSIPELETVSDNNLITNVNSILSVYSRGNVRFDSHDSSRTLFHAVKNNASDRITVSIGQEIAAPTENALEVNGNVKITDNTTIHKVLTVSSNIYAKSVISQTSDARLKTNLQIIEEPLEKISKLTGYTFDRIDMKSSARDTGLIAQDVLAILPEAVSTSSDGYYSLAYGNMAGLFVECIKKLSSRINELEEQVQQLQSLPYVLHRS